MAESGEDTLFLPNFCDIRVTFAVVVVGELLALVLVLSASRQATSWWQDLALTSLFIQWVGLSSAGLLCAARPALRRLGDVAAGVAGYALVLLVTVALSEAAYWLVEQRFVVPGTVPAWELIDGGFVPALSAARIPGPVAWHVEFVARNTAICAIVTAVAMRYFYVQHKWRMNVQSEARSRIQALQSRIRPHFLFNSMNTIASLARSDPEQAERVTEDLAELFRASLGDASIPVSLERELDLCRHYLGIEAQRLGDRITTRWEVDGLPGDALLPCLTLQPLLENAVYHGIERSPAGGEIALSGHRENGTLVVAVSNPAAPPGAHSRAGNRMAQDNVAQRLEAYFGDGAALSIDAGAERYTVTLRFPYRTEAPAA